MHIGKDLARQAKKKGICDEWFSQMKTLKDKEALVEMYVRGIDFCLANDYPSNEYIEKHFKGMMEAQGVHLDECIDLINEERIIALGKCSGWVETKGYQVTQLYVKHDSTLAVTARDNSFIMIDQFDNSRLTVTATGKGKVCINHYGGEIKMESDPNAVIKVIEKHKKTY